MVVRFHDSTEDDTAARFHDDNDNTSYATSSSIATTATAACNNQLLLDSGATENIVGNKTWLHNINKHNIPWHLKTANGGSVTVEHTGDMILPLQSNNNNNMSTSTIPITVKDVSLAAGLRTNLLSPGALIDQMGFDTITLHRDKATLHHQPTDTTYVMPRAGKLWGINMTHT